MRRQTTLIVVGEQCEQSIGSLASGNRLLRGVNNGTTN
jgi:hypothetical protein